jgi:chitinase
MVSFQKIKSNLIKSILGWTKEWSDEHQVPYAHSGSDWVGYDDTESIAIKVS